MNSQVAIVKCDSYVSLVVGSAVHQSIELLGGIARFVKPGQRVLIKPNALMGDTPEHAVTTHPAVISAVIKSVIKAGGMPLVGDSPGNASANVPATMEKTGIKQAVESSGGKMVYFQQEGIIKVKSPSHNQRVPEIPIAKPALEADVIINLPKLKTHNLTLYTGAIKNMFGAVPGFYKTHIHAQGPRPVELSDSLVDVFEIVKPTLNIMDAVVGMEGNGPSAGPPRKMGAVMASADGVALDALCSYLIGFSPDEIHTTILAYKRGLGEMDLKKIDVFGMDPQELKAGWEHPLNLDKIVRWVPPFIFDLVKSMVVQLKIDPVIDQEKCTQCLICVRNCPAKTIHHDPKRKIVEIELKDCIHCFCCHELCEFRAIELRSSWLARLLRIA